jgi:fructokinase
VGGREVGGEAGGEVGGEGGWLAAYELGGTKTLVGLATQGGALVASHRIPTRTPEQTFAGTGEWFRAQLAARGGRVGAVGVAAFGPLDLARGQVSRTPKEGWSGADLRGLLAAFHGAPVVLDTDVNAAALAEHRRGAAQGARVAVYVTVGTGIGAGVVIGGRPLHGLVHPEAGHLRLRRRPEDSDFRGVCPFHGDCVEGLASGPAMRARWGVAAEDLAPDHPGWAIEAAALGGFLASLVLTLSPERLVLGGSVALGGRLGQGPLLARVRRALAEELGGYVAIDLSVDGYLVSPALGGEAGLLGAIELARGAGGARTSPAVWGEAQEESPR